MDRLEGYVALGFAAHVGPVRARRLLDRFGTVDSLASVSSREWQSVEGIGPEAVKSLHGLKDGSLLARAREEIAAATNSGVTILDLESERYPALLREIYDPPLTLYVKGVVPTVWSSGIGIVGSRLTSAYGQEMARKFGYQLAYAGLPVVSGLARGIDTSAHMGALAAKGVTWAVLGCSVDQIYPSENQELAERILEKGCLISELPLGTAPDRQTFPRRNRLISGLSFGVLVVEAGVNSGALITARTALDQGRGVFAIPGRIDTIHAKGTNQLIKEGAKLIDEVQDILSERSMIFDPPSESAPRRSLPADLTPIEEQLMKVFDSEEIFIDHIVQKTGLPSGTVSSTLLRLEMRKLVRQLPGKVFVRVE